MIKTSNLIPVERDSLYNELKPTKEKNELFKLKENNTSFKTEVIAGLTTF